MNPDALFGLKDQEKPEGQNTTHYFPEIVRSRESEYERQQSYFMRKMEAFVAYHRGRGPAMSGENAAENVRLGAILGARKEFGGWPIAVN